MWVGFRGNQAEEILKSSLISPVYMIMIPNPEVSRNVHSCRAGHTVAAACTAVLDPSLQRQQGKIKYLGFSFHDSYEVFETIASARKWDFCQIQLNYMDTEEQAGLKGYELTEKLEPSLQRSYNIFNLRRLFFGKRCKLAKRGKIILKLRHIGHTA